MCGAVGSSNVHRSSTRLSERTNGGRLVQNVDLGFGPRRPNSTTLRKILRSGHGMIPFILPLKHALKLLLYYRVAGGSYYHRPQHARLLLDVGINPPPFHMYKSPSLPITLGKLPLMRNTSFSHLHQDLWVRASFFPHRFGLGQPKGLIL